MKAGDNDKRVAEVVDKLREALNLAQGVHGADMLIYLITSALTEADEDSDTRRF